MAITENQKNTFIKVSDKVESYLLRIIKRYFELESEYNRATAEAIIDESIQRINQIVYSKYKGNYVFSFNEKTGIIKLTIRDFNGEPIIPIKYTAFNKDFGNIEDTICEGNDPRLSDAREPVYHEHEIDEINGLKEKLNLIIRENKSHIHRNKNVLDILDYTGTYATIDLIALDFLEEAVQEYIAILKNNLKIIKNTKIEIINILDEYYIKATQLFEDLKEYVKTAINWLEEALRYTDKNIIITREKILKELLKYLNKQEYEILRKKYSEIYFLTNEGYVDIPDGEVSYTLEKIPVGTETTEASSENGDALKKIFDEGLRLGNDDWLWDDTVNSFVYQHNEQNSYPMFISLNKFSEYTHRVTLKSDDPDNDLISVVIAYDSDTNSHLSLLLCTGGLWSNSISNKTIAAVSLNYNASYNISDSHVICSGIVSENATGWNELAEGITVLIKRNNNNIKIWINYNTPNTWEPETINDIKSIYPIESPFFEFNLENDARLSVFKDKKCNYGYGCFSQALSRYEDVYFIGPSTPGEETVIYDYSANIATKSEVLIDTTPSDLTLKNTFGKYYINYKLEEDGVEYMSPLPFSYLMPNKDLISVQANFINNETKIETVVCTTAIGEIKPENIYNDSCIIISSSKKNYQEADFDVLHNNNQLCFVNSQDKLNFILNLISSSNLPNDSEFYIGGLYGQVGYEESSSFEWSVGGNQIYTWTNWDTGEPVNTTNGVIYMTSTGKWKTDTYDTDVKRYYIIEHKFNKISDYFYNPRIHYQIFNTKEVT